MGELYVSDIKADIPVEDTIIALDKGKDKSNSIICIKSLDNNTGKNLDRTCDVCHATFSDKYGLKRHKLTVCSSALSRKKSLLLAKEGHSFTYWSRIFNEAYGRSTNRDTIFIYGPPECGKSTWIKNYLETTQIAPDTRVFLFTSLEHDDTFDNISGLFDKVFDVSLFDFKEQPPKRRRRKADEGEEEDADMIAFEKQLQSGLRKMNINKYQNSICIFDDIVSSAHKKGTKRMYALLEDMLKNGRHRNISVIYTSQTSKLGNSVTRNVFQCMSTYVMFPSFTTEGFLKEICLTYIGLKTKLVTWMVDHSNTTTNRWVAIKTTHVQAVVSPAYVMLPEYHTI